MNGDLARFTSFFAPRESERVREFRLPFDIDADGAGGSSSKEVVIIGGNFSYSAGGSHAQNVAIYDEDSKAVTALKGNQHDRAATYFRESLQLNPMIWEAFEGLCALGTWRVARSGSVANSPQAKSPNWT